MDLSIYDYYQASMVELGQSMRRNCLSISFSYFGSKYIIRLSTYQSMLYQDFFFFFKDLAWVVFQFENHTFQWRKFELNLVSLLPEELKSYFKIVFLIRYGVLLFFLLYLLNNKQSTFISTHHFFFYNSKTVNHFNKLRKEWNCKLTKLFINNSSLTQ